jgi:hypothetical protein
MPAPLPGGAIAAESSLGCGAGEIRRLPGLPACGDPYPGRPGPAQPPLEMPKLQPFVTFPWSDSSNGSFAVEGPEAGIYNAARGLDPR